MMNALELRRRVRAQIVDNPETHDQEVYHVVTDCGTTACVAGWAALLHPDYEFVRPVIVGHDGPPDDMTDVRRVGGDVVEFIYQAASRILDVNDSTAGYLFSWRRTHQEVVEALDELIGTGSTCLARFEHWGYDENEDDDEW